jgi:hypothetical protein
MGGLPAAGARLAAVFAATFGWRCWRRHRWPWLWPWLLLARRPWTAAPSSRGRARQRSGNRAAACEEDGQLVPARPALRPTIAARRFIARCQSSSRSGQSLPVTLETGQLVAAISSLQPLREVPLVRPRPQWLYCVLFVCFWPGCVASALCALLQEHMAAACL